MNKFLKRLMIFFTAVLGLNFILNCFFFGVTDDRYQTRYDYLETNLDENKTPSAHTNLALKLRESFLKDTASLQRRAIKLQQEFVLKGKNKGGNKAHADKLSSLIQQSNALKIKLFLVVPPRLRSYHEILATISMLPSANVVEVANPLIYKEFWMAKYAYDSGHMNQMGALIFSECLSDKFINTVLKRNQH